MNEDFLHYVWKFQKFSSEGLCTTKGESIQVLKVGVHNFDAGPDFLMGEVVIDDQLWAGMIELHLKSSHWYSHGHETDPAYDTVILHVVWEHDREVFREDETPIPTLELKDRIEVGLLSNYFGLLYRNKQWINCESELGSIDDVIFNNWLDRMFMERLQLRSEFINEQLARSQNNWEALLFLMLCKNFGLKVNGDSFASIAQSIDYKVVQKCRQRIEWMEALLMGQGGMLQEPKVDDYHKKLRARYQHLESKFKLSNNGVERPRFFRLRPANFPTLRLSQFAMLWCEKVHLFSELLSANTSKDFYKLFDVSAGNYWDTHYNFGVKSAKRKKKLSKKFIDLLIINTVIPMKYCYAKHQGKDISEEIIALANSVKSERNIIIDNFNRLRNLKGNALDGQGLLQLKKHYCDQNKCIQCAIGNSILKRG